MEQFKNIEYDYKTEDDVFIARGLQLNAVVDEVNIISAALDEGGAGFGAGSGLTENGTNLDLGGTLDADVIFADDGSNRDFYIGQSGDRIGNLVTYANSFTAYVGGYVISASAQQTGTPPNRGIQVNVIGGMHIFDSVDLEGFQYSADYSVNGIANIGDRWIPDYGAVKAYADSVGGGGSWTKNGTELSPTTGGDDILLAAGSVERILFGNTGATTAIHAPDTDQINVDISGTWRGRFDGNGLAVNGRITASSSTCSFTGLGSNDTEDHVVAINDSTGLMTKRSVASIAGGGMVYPDAGIALSTGSAWGTSIANASANWNTAYGWGDHSGMYDNAGTMTTHESTYNHPNYTTAYNWGNHASGGYLTANQTITLSGDVSGSGTTSISVTIASTAVESGMLNNNVISGQTDLPSGLASTDELFVSDAGLLKRMDISVIQAYMQANLTISTLTMDGSTANGLVTYGGANNIDVEPNATFNGSTLAITGAITATGEITAYVSDKRLKRKIKNIENPIEKVMQINGVTHEWIEGIEKLGFTPTREVETATIAQEIGAVIPDGVCPAPFDVGMDGKSISGENYLTVRVEKIVPLLIEAIKAQQKLIEELQNK